MPSGTVQPSEAKSDTNDLSRTDDQSSLLDKLSGPLTGPVKGARPLLAHAFFAVDNRGLQPRIVVNDGGVRIEVIAGRDLGVPTVFDADLIFYVATRVARALDHGIDPETARTQEFHVHDFLRATGRAPTAGAYEAFDHTLSRLRAARIETNIEVFSDDASGEIQGVDGFFHWFDSGTQAGYTRDRNGRKRRDKVRIVLGEWLMRVLVNDRAIFSVHERYFELTGGIERRLYAIARVHVGRQDRFEIRLSALMEKVGGASTLSKFGVAIRDVADRQPLPEFLVEVVEPSGVKTRRSRSQLERTKVVLRRRSNADSSCPGKISVRPDPVKSDAGNVIAVDTALYRRLKGMNFMQRLPVAEKALTVYQAQHGTPFRRDRAALADDLPALCAVLVELGLENE